MNNVQWARSELAAQSFCASYIVAFFRNLQVFNYLSPVIMTQNGIVFAYNT